MRLKYELLRGDEGAIGRAPLLATDGSAGFDLTLPTRVVLFPGARCCVPLLVAFDLEEPYYIEIFPRSSLLVKYGLYAPTSIIDNDYKKGVHAIMVNLSQEKQVVNVGTRVMQMIVKERILTHLEEVPQILDVTGRGGMGSTG